MIEIPLKHIKDDSVELSNFKIDLEDTSSLPIFLRIEEDSSRNISIMLDYSDSSESKENYGHDGIIIVVGKKTGRVYRFILPKADYLNRKLMDEIKDKLFNRFESRYKKNVYTGLEIVVHILKEKEDRIGM